MEGPLYLARGGGGGDEGVEGEGCGRVIEDKSVGDQRLVSLLRLLYVGDDSSSLYTRTHRHKQHTHTHTWRA
jgi:hypothetical protein